MGGKQSVEASLPEDFPDDAKLFGLANFGNTCYFNSVVQSLYFCPVFRNHCLEYYDKMVKTEKLAGNASLLTCLATLYHEISSHKNRTGTLQPREFVQKLRQENDLFNNPNHQDAQEFLNYLLNQISDDLRRDSVSSPKQISNGNSGQKPTFVQNIFEGVLTNETQCLRCENTTQRDEKFLDLSLDIDENTSLTHCLKRFSSKTNLNKGDKYECSECFCKQEAHKRMPIKSLPRVLVLHMKRFKYVEKFQGYKKLFYRVSFPFHLKVETLEEAEDGERDYHLFAVIVHIGGGARFGHYVSMVKTHGRWFLYDDDEIVLITEAEVQRCFGSVDSRDHSDGYVLFYQS